MRTALAVSIVLAVLPSLAAAQSATTPPRPWGEEQATGEPNTTEAGDRPTAWASTTPDDQDEWLELDYAEPVEPVMVMVYETYNPGALCKISAYTATGMDAELWSGNDPTKTADGIGVSEIKIRTKLKTKRIRLHFKSKDVPGWNEIDAVGLKDAAGKVHWAVAARASSTYATVATGATYALGGGVLAVPMPEIFAPTEITPPAIDPRDERVDRLEREVRELRKAVEELKAALESRADRDGGERE